MSRSGRAAVVALVRTAFGELRSNADLQVLFLAYGGIWFVTDLYTQLVPLLFQHLGIAASVLGLAWSAVAAVEILFSPVTGVVADEYDRMTVGAVACLLLAGLFGLFAVVEQVAGIVTLMVLIGALRLLLGNTATAAVSENLPDAIDGMGWGLRDACLYAGGALGLAGGGLFVARTERPAGAFLLVVPVLLSLAGLFGSRGTFARPARRSLPDPEVLSPASVRERFREISNWVALRRLLLAKLLAGLGIGGTMFLLPVFAVDLGVGSGTYLLLFAASNLAGVAVSLVGGVLSNVLDTKRLYVGNFAIEAAMLLTFAATTTTWVFVVGLGLFAAQTVFEPAVMAFFFEQFADEEAARAWSVSGLVSKSASLVAPVLGGVAYTVSPRLTFAAGGVLTALAAVAGATVPRGS